MGEYTYILSQLIQAVIFLEIKQGQIKIFKNVEGGVLQLTVECSC